jgi:polyisoprenoid-binding protein YceI
MVNYRAAVALLSLLPLFVPAAPGQKFDMTDPKGVSGLSFSIDSTMEPILGTSSAISGEVVFDAANPEKSTGKIVVATAGVRTASDGMTQAMQGDWCLAPKKYPTIEFAVTKISNVKAAKDGSLRCTVAGDFSFHGVTKAVEADAFVTRLPDMIEKRGGMEGKKGDLLVIRSTFKINRRDYNVATDLSSALVGDIIEVKLATVGVSPKP